MAAVLSGRLNLVHRQRPRSTHAPALKHPGPERRLVRQCLYRPTRSALRCFTGFASLLTGFRRAGLRPTRAPFHPVRPSRRSGCFTAFDHWTRPQPKRPPGRGPGGRGKPGGSRARNGRAAYRRRPGPSIGLPARGRPAPAGRHAALAPCRTAPPRPGRRREGSGRARRRRAGRRRASRGGSVAQGGPSRPFRCAPGRPAQAGWRARSRWRKGRCSTALSAQARALLAEFGGRLVSRDIACGWPARHQPDGVDCACRRLQLCASVGDGFATIRRDINP
jgi:hypothetical protein